MLSGDDYMYEKHIVYDELMPFWFHKDKVTKGMADISNWHHNIEILYFVEGCGEVICDMEAEEVCEGDIFVINSNSIHSVKTDDVVRYYCLIIDKKFCDSNGIECSKRLFTKKIKNNSIAEKYQKIVDVFKKRTAFYKTRIRVSVLDLLVSLVEDFSAENKNCDGDKQTEIIKRVIEYINDNYSEEITIDGLSQFAGYSRAHLSRQFKKATGLSIIEYINYIRCTNAHTMLVGGSMTVSEVALECGFSNMSYFSKIYKRVIGKLPSVDSK